jgi:hypothetical protein
LVWKKNALSSETAGKKKVIGDIGKYAVGKGCKLKYFPSKNVFSLK